jgi:hypothetical protein
MLAEDDPLALERERLKRYVEQPATAPPAETYRERPVQPMQGTPFAVGGITRRMLEGDAPLPGLSDAEKGQMAEGVMRTAIGVAAPIAGAYLGGPFGAAIPRALGAAPRGVAIGARVGQILGAGTGNLAGGEALGGEDRDNIDRVIDYGLGAGAEGVAPYVGPAASGAVRLAEKIPGVGPYVVTPVANVARRAAERLRAPFGARLRPGAEQAVEDMGGAAVAQPGQLRFSPPESPVRGVIPPGQLTESPFPQFLQNVGEASIGGGGIVEAAQEGSEKVALLNLDEYIAALRAGGDLDSMAAAVSDAIEGGSKQFTQAMREVYTRIDELAQPEIIERQVTRMVPREITEEIPARGYDPPRTVTRTIQEPVTETVTELGRGAVDLTRLRDWAKKTRRRVAMGIGRAERNRETIAVLDDILSRQKRVTWQEAHELRSTLASIGRNDADLVPGRLGGIGKNGSRLTDIAMQDAARELPEELLPLYREASQLWREGKERFGAKLIERFAANDPDGLLLAIKPERRLGIRNLREIVMKQDPEAWKRLQGEWAVSMLNRAADNAEGVVSGPKLERELKRYHKSGALRELFPEDGGEGFLRIAATLRSTQQNPLTRTGAIAIQLAQAGAVIGLIGEDPRESASIVLGPAALAYIVTRPRAARYLSVGAAQVPGSRLAARAFSQLVAELGRQKLIDVKNDVRLGSDPVQVSPEERRQGGTQ